MNTEIAMMVIETAALYLLIALAVIGAVRLALEKIQPTTPRQKREYREFVRRQRILEARQKAGLDQPRQKLCQERRKP